MLLVQDFLVAGIQEFLLGVRILFVELVGRRHHDLQVELLEEGVEIGLMLADLLQDNSEHGIRGPVLRGAIPVFQQLLGQIFISGRRPAPHVSLGG
ncbi:hypothetical protein D3C87_1884570 [compost metagenome]